MFLTILTPALVLLLATSLAPAHPPMCPAPPPCRGGAPPPCPCTSPPPPRTVLMTMDVDVGPNNGSWTTINWVRIPTVAQMGGANSSTIMAMAQCRFRVCHASGAGPGHIPGKALDPHCPTGNGIGGSPDYMDLCSRVSHDDGRTWGPLATNVTGGLWAGMIASGAEARNDTDGRSADPNLLYDAKRGKMLLFFDTRNPNQTSWVTSSSDGVQWARGEWRGGRRRPQKCAQLYRRKNVRRRDAGCSSAAPVRPTLANRQSSAFAR